MQEDVWNSEEEVEESSDDGSDEDSSDSNAAEKMKTPGQRGPCGNV